MLKYSCRESKIVDPSAPLQIDAIDVVWVEDEGQPEFLGEYSNTPGPGAIDREALGERRDHEFRYFNPMNYEPDYPQNAMLDYRRYEAFCLGEWSMQGCVAKALVSYPLGAGVRRMEVLGSAGIYGIESDSDEAYKLETTIEQLQDLKAHVQVFHVPWSIREETVLIAAIAELGDLRKQANEKAQRTANEQTQ